MATLNRMRVHWTGFTGSPGVNTLFFDGAADPAPAVRALFDAIKAYLAPTVTCTFDSTGDQLDSVSGALTGTWSGTSAAAVVSTATNVYSAASGAVITWRTNHIINRRRLIAKTFLVPLAQAAYDNDGSLGSTFLGAINPALATYLASAAGVAMKAWHRPHGGTGGLSDDVLTATVPDKAVVLRSRRD